MAKKLSIDEILIRFKIKHENLYTYFLIDDIKSVHSKIGLVCEIHGESNVIIWDHLSGSICKKCSIENIKKIQSKGTKIFIEESVNKFKNKFSYDHVIYINNRTKVKIECKDHNIIFDQTPYEHLKGHSGCKFCKIKSKGEIFIFKFLIKNNIKFLPEHSFKGCKSKHILKFDFYLPDYNILIEFDGVQHFEKRWNSEIEFKRTQTNDQIKNNWSIDNGIKLYRIKYTEINNIDDILQKIINNL